MAKSLTIGDLLFRLGYENDDKFVADLEGILKKAEKSVEKGGREAGEKGGKTAAEAFNQRFKATFSGAALGSFLGTALAQAFSGAINAARQFAIDSVKEFAVYEQGLLQLKLAGETNLGALSKRIQDTARSTKIFSATDVSLAVGELVKAGYDAETAFALVETGALGASSEIDALTGKFGDLSGTSKSLGNILRALGYDVDQSGRVMDVLARAAQDSNLNVSDLVDIVSRVGPTAKLAGLEIEDLAAMAGVLANNGMEASLIGTGLRSVLQSLINPSGNVKAELDKLGISLVDSNGNLRDFSEVLDGLHELTERGGEGLQLLTAATGSFGSAAAASLGAGSEAVKDFRRNMEDAEGTAQTLADTMRGSAAGAAAELQARLADARAELGEQLMPHLLTMNETILPAMVTVLGEVIALWQDWEFILTGTTTALKRANEAARVSTVDAVGQELADAVDAVVDARQRVSDAERAIELAPYNYGAGARRREAELAAAKEALAVAEAHVEVLKRRREQQALLGSWEGGDGSLPFGPLPAGTKRPEQAAAAIEQLAGAYRNLAAIETELAEARKKHAEAASAEEEARWAAEIKRLEAEKKAKEAAVKTAEATAKAAKVEKDPLIEEAQRVQNDLQRLKLAYQQGELAAAEYVDAMDAHLRRLDGLYERSGSPEQSLAVLRARQAFLDEIARLEKESAVKLESKPFAVVDMDEVRRQQRMADARARNNQRMVDELVAQEKALDDWRVQHAQDAADEQARITDELLTIEGAQQDYALQQWIAKQQKASEEEQRIEEEKAAARARNNQRVVNELVAQEAAYTAWLGAEAERRAAQEAEAAARRAAMGRRDARIQALANLYPGYSGNAASTYTTLAERASGSVVKLAQAQRTLGQATRDDVQAALEGQIAAIERLLPIVGEGSDRYYELVAALEQARGALERLNAEVPEARIPGMGSIDQIKAALRDTESTIARIQAQIAEGPDSVTLQMLESRLAFFRALLEELRQALALQERAATDETTRKAIEGEAEALAERLMDIAASFPKALVEGIRTGDIEGALQGALGSAADFFLDMMLKAILGPITEQLAASIASSMAAQSAGGAAAGAAGAMGALGPLGLVLGGLAVVASLVSAGQQRKAVAERPAVAARAAVSGAPSVTYNLSANVEVNSNAAWSDPAFTARWRSETEALVVSLLSKVRKS